MKNADRFTVHHVATFALAMAAVTIGAGCKAGSAQDYGTEQRTKGDLPKEELEYLRKIPPDVAMLLEGTPDDGVKATLLTQNRPNPFREGGRTEISFHNRLRGHVILRVLDIEGREVATLYDFMEVPPGRYRVAWFGVDSTRTKVPPGIYRYNLKTPDISLTRSLCVTPRLTLEKQIGDQQKNVREVAPEAVAMLEVIMAAYQERDADLLDSLLAADFQRIIVPGNLGWRKKEEIEWIRDIFESPSVSSVSFAPKLGVPRDSLAGSEVIVPIVGGSLVIKSQDNQDTRIPIGNAEIVFRRKRVENTINRWEIAVWREYSRKNKRK